MNHVRPRPDLYEEDFVAWTEAQARALRAGDATALDWENLAEEIESLGRSDRRTVLTLMQRIIEHRLKLDYDLQEEPRRHWQNEIAAFQRHLRAVLGDSPSLRARAEDMLATAWRRARRQAAAILHPSVGSERELPPACPYRLEDIAGPADD
jgi:hypothetical protein